MHQYLAIPGREAESCRIGQHPVNASLQLRQVNIHDREALLS
jgi:hypothetical protein